MRAPCKGTASVARGCASLNAAERAGTAMIVVGLTGGIATGKSTVTTLLRHHGLTVIDCDEIAHAVLRQVAALPLAETVHRSAP